MIWCSVGWMNGGKLGLSFSLLGLSVSRGYIIDVGVVRGLVVTLLQGFSLEDVFVFLRHGIPS